MLQQQKPIDSFKLDIIHLIAQNFGNSAATTFQEFYYDEDRQVIVNVAITLLSDLIGNTKTKELILTISQKNNVKIQV